MDYFVSTSGDDNNAGNTTTAPWKTLAKVQSMLNSLQANDRVLFNRGDKWREKLTITGLQPSNGYIVFADYGTGSMPVFDGSITVSNFVNTSGNIYKADLSAIFTDSTIPDGGNPEVFMRNVNGVYFNGKLTSKGRFPSLTSDNGGYIVNDADYPFGSPDYNRNKIVSSEFEGLTHPDSFFLGAELVARTREWILDIVDVQSITGAEIITDNKVYGMLKDYGFFFQNKPEYLSSNGEWSFDKTSKELYVYFSSPPSGYTVEVPVIDNVFTLSNCKNIIVENIALQRGRLQTFSFQGNSNCHLRDVHIRQNAKNGIAGSGNSFCHMNFTASDTQNNNCDMKADNSCFKGVIIEKTGLVAGMGASGNGAYFACDLKGKNNIIEESIVKDSGYAALFFGDGPWSIHRNRVEHFCKTKTDGGGVYTFDNYQTLGNNVFSNAVYYGYSSKDGVPDNYDAKDRGLYSDGASQNITWKYNLTYACGEGALLHQSTKERFWKNIFVGSATRSLRVSWDDGHIRDEYSRNNDVQENIFVHTNDFYPVVEVWSQVNDALQFGLIDNNKHVMLTKSMNELSPLMYYSQAAGSNRYYINQRSKATYAYGQNDILSTVTNNRFTNIANVGSTMVKNGTFDSSINANDNFYKDTGANSDDRFQTVIESNGITGRSLRAYFTNAAPDYVGYMGHKFLSLEKDKYYRLMFDVRGVVEDAMSLILRTNNDNDKLHLAGAININTTTTSYSVVFRARDTITNGKLLFLLKATAQSVLFDNISLYQVNVTEDTWNNKLTVPKNLRMTGLVTYNFNEETYVDENGTVISSAPIKAGETKTFYLK